LVYKNIKHTSILRRIRFRWYRGMDGIRDGVLMDSKRNVTKHFMGKQLHR